MRGSTTFVGHVLPEALVGQSSRGGSVKHVLVIDGDHEVRSLLTGYLERHGFRVTAVIDGTQLDRILYKEIFDAFVVELNLAGEDGLDIVRRLAHLSDAPILIITGDRTGEADVVAGLEVGASDYILKPLRLGEFVARLRAATRDKTDPKIQRERRAYVFAGWHLSVKDRTLRFGAATTKLTTAEFNLLVALLSSPGRILSRDQLMSASRVHPDEVMDRSIDALILRLRRKLEIDPSDPVLIRTERGIGYSFDCEVTIEEVPRLRR